MRILESFPSDAVFGHCLIDGQVASGRCVDLRVDTDLFPKGRARRLILSEKSIRGIAGHFGMIDEALHQRTKDRIDSLEEQLGLAESKIEALLGALQAFGLPEPTEPVLPKPKPKKKVAS